MKFEVASSELLKKLQIAFGVIVPNPVLPVTEDFLFNLEKDTLHITATNVDTTIETWLPVNTIEKGVAAIPAKILLETLKALPDQPITISSNKDNNAVEITSSYGKYNLSGDLIEDFPTPPQEEGVESIEIESMRLASVIAKTMFATSNDELRMAMTGVLMHIDSNSVVFVATDAHKLVKYTISGLETEVSTSIILPKKALGLLKNSLASDGMVKISFNKKNAFFKFGDVKVISRLIDATYPDFNAVIPVDNPYELRVNKKDFQNSLRRIGIYANKSTNQVILNMNTNSLTLSAKDMDFSNEATEQLACTYTGDTMSMGFNSKIFVDMLNNVDTDEAILQMSMPSRAGILVPSEQEENEHLLMLVMPVLSSY